ncbi:maleylpyruvate isomerase [Variovorax boronicumulans]|uniref:maleylacetoacetate isomerase n=1 Tax=Variovorax boronicumulans TaxID=436515 RepID=UPI00277D867D|nr:maleylacetoacetate isomerase [Variovorax boronicumulans]MDQ0038431.1 maleylpyruvate isomerase [Variovorax boronicumulans]
MTERVLHTYYRSSASYRIRIALNLKGLTARHVPVHLNRGGGEQFGDGFRMLNPQALVPVLSEGGLHISQSLAILEYLEDRYPSPPLLPVSLEGRARARALALDIACEIHPLNNLRVLKFLTGPLKLGEEEKLQWIRHWITLGFDALENNLAMSKQPGPFCVGDQPSIADCCLVPQVFSARRFEVDMSPYPILQSIDQACQSLPAFADARPGVQPDAE